MEENFKKQLSERIKEWCSQGDGYSQAQFAQKLGISGAYVSKMVSGDWDDKHPGPAMWMKVARFFNDELHLNTYNFQAIQGACKRAQDEKTCWGVDGYSGAGKTYALAHYAKTKPNVYHIIGRESMSARDFLSEIAAQIGVTITGTRYDIEKAITQKLSGRNALLIFDELEFLKPACYFNIKSFHDLLVQRRQAGIIISGMGIQETIKKGKTQLKRGMPQFHRRFDGRWVEMAAIQKKEIREACQLSGITNAQAINWFVEHVNNYDSLNILIRDAIRVADGQDVTLDTCIQYLQN